MIYVGKLKDRNDTKPDKPADKAEPKTETKAKKSTATK